MSLAVTGRVPVFAAWLSLASCSPGPGPVDELARFEVFTPDGERVGQSVLSRPRGDGPELLLEALDVAFGKTRTRLRASLLRLDASTLHYQALRTVNRQLDDITLDLAGGELSWSQRQGLALREVQAPAGSHLVLEELVPFGQITSGGVACWWDFVRQVPVPEGVNQALDVVAARSGRVVRLSLSLRERAPIVVGGRPREGLRLFARTATTGQTLWLDAADRSLLALELPGGLLARRHGVELPARAPVPRPAGLVEEIVAADLASAHLEGTLSHPGQTPAPALLIVHGSGAIDRDGGAPGKALGIYVDLAWRLGQAGIAVLRYDKRGVGKSTRREDVALTLDVLRDDAASMLDTMAEHPAVDPHCLFALGHSEGGYIAPALGNQKHPLAGAILVAGSARPLDKVMVDQLGLILESASATPEEMDTGRKQQAVLFKLLRSGKDRSLSTVLGGEGAAWLRSHLLHDPASVLRAQPAPVLSLYASLDIQVPATEAELQALRAARAELPLQIEILDGLDHLFMRVDGEAGLGQYFDPDRRLAPEMVDHLVAWMRDQPCVAARLSDQAGDSVQDISSASSLSAE
ncbi:MAG: alpha/beta hydrolase [Pseudomonadota bacterium]